MKYVNIIIDNRSDSTDNLYTYGCCDDSVTVGSKVYVPFARSRTPRDGYVVSFEDSPDDELKSRLRYVDSKDEDVSLSEEMMIKMRQLINYIECRCWYSNFSNTV